MGEEPIPFRVAISASFTAEPLERVISFWNTELEAHFQVDFAPYNQVLQTLLDPGSVFARNTHGVNVLLLRLHDLSQEASRIAETVEYLMNTLRDAVSRFSCPVILSSDDDELLAPAAEIPGLHVLPHREIDRFYPVTRKHDPEANRLAQVPYSEEWFVSLGTALVRRIAALSLPPYKVIAIDCDNTLWEGICGEDGPGGVRLDAPRKTLHEFLLAQRDTGMVLCLASKNNADDVADTFRQHPEFPLQLEHFTASRVNWESKAENLESLANELGLGLDSFILIDDSAKECAEVEDSAPEVLALALPADSNQFVDFLDHVWAFDHPAVTEEDRKRADSYAQAQEFGRAFHSAHSLQEFMDTLDLQVTIEPVTAARFGRVAQLTQRTNQFNFTGEKRSEAEVSVLHDCFTVEVSDRFGEYGLVGAMVLDGSGEDMEIESFLLSCRVLGRGVEHRMLAYAGDLAARGGFPFVSVRFTETGRNQPARQFLQSIGKGLRFPSSYLQALRWTPSPAAPRPEPSSERPSQHRFVPFARIARELSTPSQILSAMRPSASRALDPSLTETERTLARIWMDLLNLPSVKPGDLFFEIGGHSLLAILLISRVRDAFGVELTIDDVYSGNLTLRSLAERVESGRPSSIAPDEYEAMMAEIEGLSDEEVRALLDS